MTNVEAVEEWRPVVGWEAAYEVSSQGRVRGLDRINNQGRRIPGRVLARRTSPRGYRYVTLCWWGKSRVIGVHRLVAEAFRVGGEGPMVLHANDVPGDDRVENLRYGTAADNNRDRVRNGHDHNLAKTTCPYGHSLKDPNLVPNGRGGRACRACKLSRLARYWDRSRTSHQELSDAYLKAIMAGAKGRIRLAEIDPARAVNR